MNKLFRQQALDYQSNRLFGEVILIRPLSLALLTAALAVMMFLDFITTSPTTQNDNMQASITHNYAEK